MKRLGLIIGWSFAGALLVGAAGFMIGFFGPILIALLIDSEANLGPLWGIFILGPLGVLSGAIVGAVIGYKKTRSLKDAKRER